MLNCVSSRYKENKSAKVGETIKCPVCGTNFVKIQYSQAFCCGECKDHYWNKTKKDRHKKSNYYKKYNMKHPERLERIGIYDMSGGGDFMHFDKYYDEDDNSYLFEGADMCDNPIEGR